MIIYAYKTTKRVRPLSKKEINEGAEKCVVAVEKTIAARDTQFTYDYVFPSNVEQIEGQCELTLIKVMEGGTSSPNADFDTVCIFEISKQLTLIIFGKGHQELRQG